MKHNKVLWIRVSKELLDRFFNCAVRARADLCPSTGGMMNIKRLGSVAVLMVVSLPFSVSAQQTLGWIDGTVTDSSGGAVQDVTVKARNAATNLEVTARTK